MKSLLLLCSLPIAVSCWAQQNVSEPFTSSQVYELAHPNSERGQRTGRDQYHQLDSTVTNAFDDQLGAWVLSEETAYAYYATGGIYSEMHMTHHISQEVSIFKETGEIDYKVTKIWDGFAYQEEMKTVYHYTPQGQPTVDSLYLFTGGTWESAGYNQYIFDNNGFLEEKWRYQDVSGVTYPVSKFVFVNDAEGKVLDLRTYHYSFSQWESKYHYYYEYDGYGREDLFTCEVWKPNGYEKVFQAESIYSAHNLLNYKMSYWESSGWVNRLNTTLEYDVNISTNSILLPNAYSLNGHKIIGKSSMFNYLGQWIANDSVAFYYSGPEPNGTEELISQPNLTLLGNPVTEILRIENKDMENVGVRIYDVTGKLLMQTNSNSSVIEIPSQTWKNGMYYALITKGDLVQSVPFVKK